MKYAALIPCGSGEEEASRVADQLAAWEALDPEDCVVRLILNDGNTGVAAFASAKTRVVDNPRHGVGWGWAGGLIAGELWSFDYLLREYPSIRCVVKLDTDALPIKPLGTLLESVFADPRVGYAGERTGYDPFAIYAETAPRPDRQRMVRKLRAPLSLWRMPRWHFRQSLVGSHRWFARLYDEAERHGYLPGDVVEGGVCAFSRECLERLQRKGVLARWRDFIDIVTGDDTVLTMLPYLVGLEAGSSVVFSPGDQRALKFSPESLLQHPGVGLVHSVKNYEHLDEAALRAIFRVHRQELAEENTNLPAVSS